MPEDVTVNTAPLTALTKRKPLVQAKRAMRRRGALFVRYASAISALPAVAAGLVAFGLISTYPESVPWSSYIPLVVFAGFFLRPLPLVVVVLTYTAELIWLGAHVRAWSALTVGSTIALVVTTGLMLWRSVSRDRIGVQGSRAEDMLVDLRDRLRSLGDIPELPAGWHAERSIRSAFGDKFSGDFSIARLVNDGRTLELLLVDLSGKGKRTATRSLLFSGALGGLVGQVPSDRLLAAANRYLVGQQWSEGFATAVHVEVDLDTGRYTIGNAGHPAPLAYRAAAHRWTEQPSVGGPALGILDDARYPRREGQLAPGDALLLFTDGMIESTAHDLSQGLDRLTANAAQVSTNGFDGGSSALVAQATCGESDDRAVVLLWRS